jgi:hypothetical protein
MKLPIPGIGARTGGRHVIVTFLARWWGRRFCDGANIAKSSPKGVSTLRLRLRLRMRMRDGFRNQVC